MEKKCSKVISLVLAIVILATTLLTSAVFTASGSGSVERTYYVCGGGGKGTGDGLSPENATGSITSVVNKLNKENITEGKIAIIVSGGEGIKAGDKINAAGTLPRFQEWPWPSKYCGNVEFTITSADPSNPAMLAFGCQGVNIGAYGNTIYKDINLIDTDLADRDIYSAGYDLEFENVGFFFTNNGTSAQVYNQSQSYPLDIYVGGTEDNGLFYQPTDTTLPSGGTLTVQGAETAFPYTRLSFGGVGSAGKVTTTIPGDASIVVNGGSIWKVFLQRTSCVTTYKGNLNVTLNDGASVGSFTVSEKSSYLPKIEGAIQLIANKGSIFPDLSSIKKYADDNNVPYYILTAEGCSVETTDTAGVFKITDGYKLTATDVSDASKTYTSVDGILTVPAGVYTVTNEERPIVEATYYVQYGGSGDGLSPETPLATVDDAVKAANAAGLVNRDIVYINVMQSDDWNWGAGAIGAGGNNRSDAHHITTWAACGTMTAHTATIVVQGYGDEEVYLASSSQLGINLDMVVGGPTVFKDITIVRMRKHRGIFANGYNVTFGAGTKVGIINVDNCDSTFKTWDGQISFDDSVGTYSLGGVNERSAGGGGTLEFYNAPANTDVYISSIADDWSSGVASGPSSDVEKYLNDVSIVFDNDEITPQIIWGNQVGGGTSFVKNLTINAKTVKELSYATGKGTVTINGDLQIIAKSDYDISNLPNNVTVKGKKWFLNNAGYYDLLKFTDKAGTYTTGDADIEVLAVDNNDPSKYYRSFDGVITLPAGSYTITHNATGDREVTYYVQYGGTGDGKSSDSPFATVDDAVKVANDAGYGKDDRVIIKVMQSKDWDYGAGVIGAGGDNRSDPHHMTTWAAEGQITRHKFTMYVQGYDEITYLAVSGQIGFNVDMVAGGPTVFENLWIVRTRMWRSLNTNGFDVTFGEGVKIGRVNVDEYNSTFMPWDGKVLGGDSTAVFSFGLCGVKPTGSGGTLTFESNFPTSTITLTNTYDVEDTTEIYEDDITVVLNNSALDMAIMWGNDPGGSTLINGNLNIDIRKFSKIQYKEGRGNIRIDGGLQIISNGGEIDFAFNKVPANVNAAEGRWFISNNSNFDLLFTETVGTFKVDGDNEVMAINSETKEEILSKNGILVIPSGEYIIAETDYGEWWAPGSVVEEELDEATVKGNLKSKDGVALSEVKVQLYSNEKTYDTVTDSNGDFSFGVILTGTYELFTVDEDGNKYSTGNYLTFEKDDIVTLNLVLDKDVAYNTSPDSNVNDNTLVTDTNNNANVKTANGIVKGNVYTPDLKPVSNITIYLGDFAKITTDKDGYFEFNEVPAGKYDIYSIMDDDSKQILRTIELAENTELSMKLKYETNQEPVQAEEDSNWPWIIIAGVIALVVAGVVVFVIVKNKRKSK